MSADFTIVFFFNIKRTGRLEFVELTVFVGKTYWSRGILFAVCSNPNIENPSRFFFSRKTFTLFTGTSMIGTHFSAVTLGKKKKKTMVLNY